MRREIQTVHEFQADERVLKNGIDSKQYQLLLIRKSVGEHKFALANNFRWRDLHKRIEMMMKNKSNKRMRWTHALLLPALFIAVIALSVPKLNAQTPKPMEQVLADEADSLKANPLVIVDGKKIPFEDIQKLLPDEIASIDVLKGNSAVDFYGEEGKNGVLLITMKKNESEDTTKVAVNKIVVHSQEPFDLNDPLYIIDGKKMGSDFKVNSIKPDQIQSISVLKDASAMRKYGEEGKNGVVIIELKR